MFERGIPFINLNGIFFCIIYNTIFVMNLKTIEIMENPFLHRIANDKFQRTSDLIRQIKPAGHYLLVEVLPFTKVPTSKIILPDDYRGDFASKARAVIVAKGPECRSDYLKVGDEVYFGSNVSSSINYPNPDEKDKMYVTLSEQSVIYYIEK